MKDKDEGAYILMDDFAYRASYLYLDVRNCLALVYAYCRSHIVQFPGINF